MGIVSIGFALSLLLAFTPFLMAGSVKSLEELKPYRGRGSYLQIDGDLRQKMFLAVFDEIQRLYRGTVDGQLHEEVVLLCPQTVDFLYSQFTPTKVSYQNGSRPVLEAKARELTGGLDSDRQKVLALLRYVRDLYKGSPDGPQSSLQGGTEEELMQSNPRFCESQSRVLAALFQACPQARGDLTDSEKDAIRRHWYSILATSDEQREDFMAWVDHPPDPLDDPRPAPEFRRPRVLKSAAKRYGIDRG